MYYQVVYTLRLALPPPVTDGPDELRIRDRAAISQVGAMLPANGEEAMLAVQIVTATAQALDCLRLARVHASDVALGLKCTAQSASMMRQANASRSSLLRMQAVRHKREADDETCLRAERNERAVVHLMGMALEQMPPLPLPGQPAAPAHAAKPTLKPASMPAATPPTAKPETTPVTTAALTPAPASRHSEHAEPESLAWQCRDPHLPACVGPAQPAAGPPEPAQSLLLPHE